MGDLEQVAERVAHHRPSISIGRVERFFDDRCAGAYRALEGRLGVIDIDVQERGEPGPFGAGRDHHQRIAEVDVDGAPRLDVSGGAEHLSKEVHLGGHVVDDDPRRHRPVAVPWVVHGHLGTLAHVAPVALHGAFERAGGSDSVGDGGSQTSSATSRESCSGRTSPVPTHTTSFSQR